MIEIGAIYTNTGRAFRVQWAGYNIASDDLDYILRDAKERRRRVAAEVLRTSFTEGGDLAPIPFDELSDAAWNLWQKINAQSIDLKQRTIAADLVWTAMWEVKHVTK